MIVAGSQTDPVVRDDLAMVKAQGGNDLEHIAMIRERLSRYRRLQRTQYYRAISELATPLIKHYECELAKPRGAYPHTPTDVLQEQRAEWRGILSVWVQLRDEPHLLEEQVRHYTEQKQKQGEVNGDAKKIDEDKYV